MTHNLKLDGLYFACGTPCIVQIKDIYKDGKAALVRTVYGRERPLVYAATRDVLKRFDPLTFLIDYEGLTPAEARAGLKAIREGKVQLDSLHPSIQGALK